MMLSLASFVHTHGYLAGSELRLSKLGLPILPALRRPGTCHGGGFGNYFRQCLILFPGRAWLQMETNLSLQWVPPWSKGNYSQGGFTKVS